MNFLDCAAIASIFTALAIGLYTFFQWYGPIVFAFLAFWVVVCFIAYVTT